MRERLYDGVCLLLSDKTGGLKGAYTEPNPEFGFAAFATSLTVQIYIIIMPKESASILRRFICMELY